MGLIDDLKRAAESARACDICDAIDEVRKTLDAAETDSFGKDLANALDLIAERVEEDYVPVPLDADGNPVELGEEYYEGTRGKFKVVGYGKSGYVATVKGLNSYVLRANKMQKSITDTQKRIDADKQKLVYEYWGCDCCGCSDCPAVVDGKRPFERFGFRECMTGCGKAMGYDLALRQAKLAAPKGAR